MSPQGGVKHEDTPDRFFGCPRQDLAGSCLCATAEFMALIKRRVTGLCPQSSLQRSNLHSSLGGPLRFVLVFTANCLKFSTEITGLPVCFSISLRVHDFVGQNGEFLAAGYPALLPLVGQVLAHSNAPQAFVDPFFGVALFFVKRLHPAHG